MYYFYNGSERIGEEMGIVLTLISASSVFSGLVFSAWDASMMGMGMKRMVKFLQKKKNHRKISNYKGNYLCELK